MWMKYIEAIKNIANVFAVIIAGYWGYSTYVSPELYRPNEYLPHLAITTNVESVAILTDRATVSVNIHITNPSKRYLRNVAAQYQAFGKMETDRITDIDLNAVSSQLNSERHLVRHWDVFERSQSRLISVGRIIPDFWWLAPGEDYYHRVVFSVPCDVSVIGFNVSLTYHVGEQNMFRADWQEKTIQNGERYLWFDKEIKAGETFVSFESKVGESSDVGDSNKDDVSKYGLQESTAMSEIDIPWQPSQDGCKAN